MKKLLYLLLCFSAMFTCTAVAQEKGDMYIGGNIGLDITSADGATTASFTIAPEYAYFITNNFRIGAELALSVAESTTTFVIEPTLAYYARLVDKLYYTPQLKIGGGIVSSNGYSTGIFAFGLDLFALEYMPSSKVGISLSLVNLNLLAMPEMEFNIFNFNLISTPQF